MPQLKQYCSGMFKREDWEVAHLHNLTEKEYENHTIQMPVVKDKIEAMDQYSDTSQNIGSNFLNFQLISMRLGM